MLEILVVVFLCIGNSKRAKERGKSGGGAVAYTLGLWIGMEILGMILGILLFYVNILLIYLIALGFAAIGGVISYKISKRGDTKVVYMQSYELSSPCTVRVYRDASEIYRDSKFFFYLNGEVLDALEDDSMLIANTKQSLNTITVRLGEEQFMRDTYQFQASPNGVVDIHCACAKFLPSLTKTISEEPEKEW